MTQDERLDEIIAWVGVKKAASLRDQLGVHVRTEIDWIVYDETDGHESREAVGELAGIGGRSVGNRWAVWKEARIVIDEPEYESTAHLVCTVRPSISARDVEFEEMPRPETAARSESGTQ